MFNYTQDGRYGKEANMPKIALHAFVAFLLLSLFLGSFGVINPAEVGVKTRLGQVVGTYSAGPYFKLPIIEQMNIVDTKVKTVDYDKNGKEGDAADTSALSASSKDLQAVWANIVVNYSVNPASAVDIYVKYRNSEQFGVSVIEPMIRETVKGITGEYAADELVTKRPVISERVLSVLSGKMSEVGAILSQANLTNFEYSKSFSDAIEAKVTATQKAETAKNDLETVKYQQQAKIEEAKAEAEAIRIKTAAVNAQGGAEYVKLKWIEAWATGGAKVPTYVTGSQGNSFLMNLGN